VLVLLRKDVCAVVLDAVARKDGTSRRRVVVLPAGAKARQIGVNTARSNTVLDIIVALFRASTYRPHDLWSSCLLP
jgi:hypothetical protein